VSELKLGPATRPIQIEKFSDLYGARIETSVRYERSTADGVIEFADTPYGQGKPVGLIERRVACVKIDDCDDKVFVLAYEIIPEHERRSVALLASARAKLTPEEFDAVMMSRNASWNV
jgi:hypothetical protein